jgi:hypothetical protein
MGADESALEWNCSNLSAEAFFAPRTPNGSKEIVNALRKCIFNRRC